jgi:hypothetical protein
MRSNVLLVLLALAFPLAPTLAGADPAPVAGPRDPEASSVPELIVTARDNGPAWWRVSKGASVVWILGAPPGLPKGFRWDSSALERRLSNANSAITPVVLTGNLFDVFAFMRLREKMKSKAPLEEALPPELRARFLADVEKLHQKPGRYDHWNALYAGALMTADFYAQARLDRNEPLPTITKMIRSHRLTPKAAATYKAVQVLDEGRRELNPQVEQACLSEALDEIEGGGEREIRAAEGWSQGNVKLAVSAAVGFQHCLNLLPEGASLARQAMADEAAAISAALEQPGTAVAVVSLRPLLAENGVLEQLKAKGYSIRAPDR